MLEPGEQTAPCRLEEPGLQLRLRVDDCSKRAREDGRRRKRAFDHLEVAVEVSAAHAQVDARQAAHDRCQSVPLDQLDRSAPDPVRVGRAKRPGSNHAVDVESARSGGIDLRLHAGKRHVTFSFTPSATPSAFRFALDPP